MIQENHSITEEQIQHFEIFGFLVRRQVFSPEEIDRINEEFDKRLATLKRENDLKDDNQIHNWCNRNPETPYVASLLEDPRIYIPSEQLLGEDAVPVYSNSNSYRENTSWHPDSRERHLRLLKNVTYLQPTTADRGSLRLIPGSHKSPLFAELHRIGLNIYDDENKSNFLEESGFRGEDIPCYIFCSQPGDVITFNQNTWHAAYGGYKDRRTCTFNFICNPKTTEETAELRAKVENAGSIKKRLRTLGSQYHPWWLANPEGNARRARWIKWLEEWGFVEAMKN